VEKKTKKPIKEWAADDRPREKMISKGAEALSNAELFAILIGSGNTKKSALELAREILEKADNSLKKLSTFTIHEIKKIHGIGPAKAITIAAALEISRRREGESTGDEELIMSSLDAQKALLPMLRDKQHEEFCLIGLNRKNKVIFKERISMGSMVATQVDIRKIIKMALDTRSLSLILGHNHPSGNLKPSNSDIELTKQIFKAAALFDIQLLDHIIISQDSYYSFMDEGIINTFKK
jgi:DNA repair protein RadC